MLFYRLRLSTEILIEEIQTVVLKEKIWITEKNQYYFFGFFGPRGLNRNMCWRRMFLSRPRKDQIMAVRSLLAKFLQENTSMVCLTQRPSCASKHLRQRNTRELIEQIYLIFRGAMVQQNYCSNNSTKIHLTQLILKNTSITSTNDYSR